MNWVGGARNRIKKKHEKKKQQEFFEKKRFDQFANQSFPTKGISQDISLLHMVANICNTPSKGNFPKIQTVDLGSKSYPVLPTVELPVTPLENNSISEENKENLNDISESSSYYYKPKSTSRRNLNSWRRDKPRGVEFDKMLFHSPLDFNVSGNCEKKQNLTHVQWASEDFEDNSSNLKNSWKGANNFNSTVKEKFIFSKENDDEFPLFKPFPIKKFQHKKNMEKFNSAFISTWLDHQKNQNLNRHVNLMPTGYNCNPENTKSDVIQINYSPNEKENEPSYRTCENLEENVQETEVAGLKTDDEDNWRSSNLSSIFSDVDDLLFDLVNCVSRNCAQKKGIDVACQGDEHVMKNVSVQTSPMKWCSVCIHDKMLFN